MYVAYKKPALLTRDVENILFSGFALYFASFGGRRSRGVCWLMSKYLKAACALNFADPAHRIYVLDIAIKCKALRFIWGYAPSDHSEQPDFFCFFQIEHFFYDISLVRLIVRLEFRPLHRNRSDMIGVKSEVGNLKSVEVGWPEQISGIM